MSDEVWILGATGRSGRALAARLASGGIEPVLVGRDATRLAATAPSADPRTVVAASVEAMGAEIARQRPAVVVNTVGPFTDTAPPVARACLAGGSHYVDLANDLVSVTAVLDLHDRAVDAGRTLVPGAGFGVLATEGVVAMLCRGLPVPDAVRTDAVASVAVEAGTIGEALAATIVDGLPEGGRRYTGGRLVRDRVAGDPVRLALPDGGHATTASLPTGELIAARRVSGAPSVVAATTLVPTGPAARLGIPLVSLLMTIAPLRTFARRRLAGVRMAARPRPREHSWGRAEVRWSDGTRREGWLRTGDAQVFTTEALAAVVTRLVAGDARPGAHTPAAAFGPEIAVDAGGTFILE